MYVSFVSCSFHLFHVRHVMFHLFHVMFHLFHVVSFVSIHGEVHPPRSAKAGGYSSLQGGEKKKKGGKRGEKRKEEEGGGKGRKGEEERKGGKFETSYLQLVSNVSRKTYI